MEFFRDAFFATPLTGIIVKKYFAYYNYRTLRIEVSIKKFYDRY